MTALRAIFDGKAFILEQPLLLSDQSEAVVILEQADVPAKEKLDTAICAYYENKPDAKGDGWGAATSTQALLAFSSSPGVA